MKSQKIAWDGLYAKGLTWKKSTKSIKEPLKNKKILELGVGNGKTLRTIINQKPKIIVAIDISNEAIKSAKNSIKSELIEYVNEDFLKYRTKEKFDVVLCYYFLNNFKEKQRKTLAKKIKNLLNKKGVILFEDFGQGDFRQRGAEVEKDTTQKQSGLIHHFFNKKEIKSLFEGLETKIEEKEFNPIRKDNSIKRKIINATIRTR